MKKIALTAALCIVHCALCIAQSCLVLTQTDGTEVARFLLASQPVLSFSGSDLVVTCGNDKLTTPMEELTTRFLNDDTPSAIDGKPQILNRKPQFSILNSQLSNLTEGETVTVYTADGKPLLTVRADSQGQTTVSLGNLPKGVYILHTRNRSFKIMNNGK